MAKSKIQKREELLNFTKKLKDAKVVLFTSFADKNKKGVNVAGMRKLKRGLRKVDSDYVVIKKTLAKRSFDEIFPSADKIGVEVDLKKLSGSLGFILGYSDQVAPVQFTYKFSKENEALAILGGILDQKLLSANEIIQLAKLPGREILLAQMVGAMKYPIQGLHNVLQANLRNLVLVLSNIKK